MSVRAKVIRACLGLFLASLAAEVTGVAVASLPLALISVAVMILSFVGMILCIRAYERGLVDHDKVSERIAAVRHPYDQKWLRWNWNLALGEDPGAKPVPTFGDLRNNMDRLAQYHRDIGEAHRTGNWAKAEHIPPRSQD